MLDMLINNEVYVIHISTYCQFSIFKSYFQPSKMNEYM